EVGGPRGQLGAQGLGRGLGPGRGALADHDPVAALEEGPRDRAADAGPAAGDEHAARAGRPVHDVRPPPISSTRTRAGRTPVSVPFSVFRPEPVSRTTAFGTGSASQAAYAAAAAGSTKMPCSTASVRWAA